MGREPVWAENDVGEEDNFDLLLGKPTLVGAIPKREIRIRLESYGKTI